MPAFLKDGFGALNHEWGSLPIATISTAREDDRGLYVEGQFHSTPDAQAARTVVRERLERGKSVGMSIGYKVADDEFKDGARHLKEVDLYEVSLVSVPANPEAQLVDIKGDAGSWDTTESSFRYRVRMPSDFQEDSFKTVVLTMKPAKISAVIGKPKGKDTTDIQSLIFSKDDWESLDKAKAWVSAHFRKDGSDLIETLESAAQTMRRFRLQRLRRAHRA